jgi:hypothetical protein
VGERERGQARERQHYNGLEPSTSRVCSLAVSWLLIAGRMAALISYTWIRTRIWLRMAWRWPLRDWPALVPEKIYKASIGALGRGRAALLVPEVHGRGY